MNKKALLQGILDTFNKDGFIPLLEKDIKKDEERSALYKNAKQDLVNDVVEQQKLYLNFERTFF